MNYYKFKTRENFYLYDVQTNHIIRMEEVVWRQIGKNITDRIDDAIHIDSTSLIRQKIKELKDTYGILPDNPKPCEIKYCLTEDEVIDHLNTKLLALLLNTTEQCNYRCVYCAYGDHYAYTRAHTNRQMSWEVAKRAVDFFLERNVENSDATVGFYGGEPLIAIELMQKVVAHVRGKTSRKVRFTVGTNGSLLTRNVIEFLIANDFIIYFTLDGPEHVHDRYRRTIRNHPTFKRILSNLKAIKSLDADYYSKRVAFNVTIAPPFQLMDRAIFFTDKEIYSDSMKRLNLVNPDETTFYSKFDTREVNREYSEQMNTLKKKYMAFVCNPPTDPDDQRLFSVLTSMYASDYIMLHHRKLLPLNGSVHPNGICTPGLRKIFITVDGKICMCEKVDDRWVIGDIDKGFDKQAIFSIINRYVDICKADNCGSCWARRLCTFCYCQIFKGDQLSDTIKATKCVSMKRSLGMHLMDYCYIMEKNPHAFDGTSVS
jgi:uncharacterized protein